MSRASIGTLLSLDRWASILGLNPWHFNQAFTALWPITACDDIEYQYAWHDADKVAREDISQAVAQAEHDIADQLGYWPAPKYIAGDEVTYPRYHDRTLYDGMAQMVRGDRKSVQTSWGRLRALGIEAKALMQAAVAVVYAGDTATISVATTLTDPNEIHVHFNVGDGADAVGSEQYRIRPLKVAISGGTATITGKKWLFIKPSLWESPTAVDGDAAASFVTTVDVYRHYCDTSAIGKLIWSPGGASCTGGCAETEQSCCATARDWEAGRVLPYPATWDAATGSYTEAACSLCYAPDKVRLNYLAGAALGADGEMDDFWARAVTYYSLCLLDRQVCVCDNVVARTEKWREDLAANISTTAGSKSHQVNDLVLSSPFGTCRGAVFAWQRVRQHAAGGGIAL